MVVDDFEEIDVLDGVDSVFDFDFHEMFDFVILFLFGNHINFRLFGEVLLKETCHFDDIRVKTAAGGEL